MNRMPTERLSGDSAETTKTRRVRALNKGSLRTFIMLIVPALLLIAGGYYWLTSGGSVSTDDAQVKQDIVSVSPQVTGQVQQVFVRNGAQVKRQAGATRVIASGCIDQQHIGSHVERGNGGLETWSLAQCKQAGRIGRAGLTADGGLREYAVATEHGGSGPRQIAPCPRPGHPPREADHAGSDRERTGAGQPRLRRRHGQRALHVDQVCRRCRPHGLDPSRR
jgi:hypothetical protein